MSQGMCLPRPDCGARGQMCCESDSCGATLVCTDTGRGVKLCTPTESAMCGGRDQPCCANAACASSFECMGGQCKTPAPCGGADQACCNGTACNDNLDCEMGRCRTSTTTGPRCGGRGQPCCTTGGAQCTGDGLQCCNNTCQDTRSDDRNCGACNNPCPTGQRCTLSACGTSTTPGSCGRLNQTCCTTGRECIEASLVCDRTSNRCIRSGTTGPGTGPGTSMCIAGGLSCTPTGPRCCTGLTCGGASGSSICCSAAGSPCTSSFDCCGTQVCTTSGTCQCRSASQTCAADSDCCSGLICDPSSRTCRTSTGTNTDTCGTRTSCSTCTAEASCGWCASTRRCVRGSLSGPSTGSCGDWDWLRTECMDGSDCGSVTYQGICESSTVIAFCLTDGMGIGRLTRITCNPGNTCQWENSELGYLCKPGSTDMPMSGCGSLTFQGECVGTTQIRYCAGGEVRTINCSAGETCQLYSAEYGYVCAPDTSTSPCPTLGFRGRCTGNTAEWCTGSDLQTQVCRSDQTCSYRPTTDDYYCVDGGGSTGLCPGLGFAGRCNGNTAEWCSGDTLQSEPCGDGRTCQRRPAPYNDFYCVANESNPCTDPTMASFLTRYGQCNGNTAEYCDGTTFRRVECTGETPECGYRSANDDYYCKPRSTPAVTCSASEFACNDRLQCITSAWVCDGGKPDCNDGSDEVGCCTYDYEVACGKVDGRVSCVYGGRCDGTVDCTDRSDESQCCPAGQIACRRTGTAVNCVSGTRCDGLWDCSDGADETGC